MSSSVALLPVQCTVLVPNNIDRQIQGYILHAFTTLNKAFFSIVTSVYFSYLICKMA